MKWTLTTGAALAILAAALCILFSPNHASSEGNPPVQPTAATLQTEHVALLADAIYATEGRCGSGQSGEYGCFQYLPSTWRAYSIDVTGKVLTQTAANERMVTQGMIRTWKDQGISDRGIFLLWNQGSATGWGPGSKDCYKGVNDHGVAYDSCDYAARGLEYLTAHSGS